MDPNSRERRPGAVDRINSAVNTAKNIQTAFKVGRTAVGAAEVASTSEIWIPIAIGIAIILIIVFVILLGGGSGSALELGKQPTPGIGGNGQNGGGNISSCQFTRSGVQNSIKSSVLAGWVTQAANTAGIPPAVLASVAMHENEAFVTSADNNSPEISSNHFCNEGSVFCEQSGQNLHPGACSDSEISQGARNARAVGLMQIVDVFNPGKDLCSITESLAIAASKLKDDGISLTPSKDDVYGAINSYYNSCTYGNYNYCDEVWQDYQSCQVPGNIVATDCPIPSGTVTCGSKLTPVNGCGHCAVGYPRLDLCTYDAINYAMDIQGNDLDPIYLPKINGSVIKWTNRPETQGMTEAIQNYTGVNEATGEHYFINFHHTQTGSGNPGDHYSGEVGARICGDGCNEGHVHVEFARGDSDWLDAPLYFCKR